MLKHWTIGTLGVLALALAFGGAANAAQTAASNKTSAAKKTTVHEIANSGVITSVDATRLTMTHKVKGKEESLTLVLTPETKREGDLKAGSKVSVRYHMENNDHVATFVRAQAETAKAKAPAAKKS